MLRASSFGHMAAAIFAKPSDLMAIIIPSPLTIYGDASGKEEDPIIAVGGVVGRVDEWLAFESKWNAVLKEFDMPYFHMREFAHSVGAYEIGWKGLEDKRKAFIDGLVKAIVPHAAYWMGCCIVRDDYLRVDAEYKLHESYYPYTICARACVELATDWRDVHYPTVPIEYIFECGDPHRGQLRDAVYLKYGVEPIFRKRDNVPLQVADFAAYEVLKLYRRLSVETDRLFETVRASFRRLWAIPAIWGQLEEANLRSWCRQANIPRRD